MDFFARFERLCANHTPPISPSGLELEKLMQAQGVKSFNRSTAGKWKENQNVPRCDFIVALANIFDTTTDYLLGRTEDVTDHSKKEPVLTETQKRLLQAFSGLDEADQADVFLYIEFRAGQEKYKKSQKDA